MAMPVVLKTTGVRMHEEVWWKEEIWWRQAQVG
jgi:hypothetical protein